MQENYVSRFTDDEAATAPKVRYAESEVITVA
jgi:hypothetical protein